MKRHARIAALPFIPCRWVLLLWSLGSASLFGQVPGFPGQPTVPPGFQSNPGFPAGPPGMSMFPQDSLTLDTAGIGPVAQIKPDARIISPRQIFLGQKGEKPLGFDIAQHPYWDGTDTVTGFVQHLGTALKPYQTFRHGLEESLADAPYWRNPVTARANRYFYHPERDVLHFDTKTPLVSVLYAQLPRQSNLIDVIVSRNINPDWNLTAFYRRHRFVGEYRNAVSDQSTLYLSGYYRSPNRRYHAFGHIGYADASDQINGGPPRERAVAPYPVVDGITREVGQIYTSQRQTFYKGLGPALLANAQVKEFRRAAHAHQYYRLLGSAASDTGKHALVVRHSADFEFHYRRFRSDPVSEQSLRSNLVAMLPTLTEFRTPVGVSFGSRSYGTGGDASYDLRGPLNLHLEAGLHLRRLEVDNEAQNFRMTLTRQRALASLVWKGADLRAAASQQLSNRFAPENRLEASAGLPLLGKRPTHRFIPSDSARSAPAERRPLRIGADYFFFDRNPSVWQRYLSGKPGFSNFTPNENLENQRINRLRAVVAWQGPVPIRKEDTLFAHRASLTAFVSRVDRAIYYDSLLRPMQAPSGSGFSYAGLEAQLLIRFLRKFHWETRLSAQRGVANATDSTGALRLYAQHLPAVYGKTSLFYDNRNLKIAGIFRVGIDLFFHTDFTGQTFDPMSGEFFPSFYRAPGFGRVDGYWSMKLSKTYVYIKMSHLNEGFPFPGYYTTPLYPMLGRTLSIGVHWNFFD